MIGGTATAVLALAEGAANSGVDWVQILSTWGPAGVVLGMVLVGFLIPKWAFDNLKADRDYWRTSSEGKDVAIQNARDRADEANKRADTSQDAAATTLRLLESLGHRRGPVDQGSPA